jgi:uncharacterized phage-associated protein
MIIDEKKREKLLNAIIYFSNNTRYCGKTKLFKLLFFFDFEHFKEVGRGVTGLTYNAWRMGPVPTKLMNEVEAESDSNDLGSDLSKAVQIKHVSVAGKSNPMMTFNPLVEFNSQIFSKRELNLLQRIAEENNLLRGEQMVEKTHLPTLPWHRVHQVEGKELAEIPYHYAIADGDVELLNMLADNKINEEIEN